MTTAAVVESMAAYAPILKHLQRAPALLLREMNLIYLMVHFALIKILHWILFWFPSQKQKIIDDTSKRTGMSKTMLRKDQWEDSIVSLQSYLSLCRSLSLDARKSVHQGGPASDSSLMTLEGKSGKLLNYQHGLRPLVVIFGSCT